MAGWLVERLQQGCASSASAQLTHACQNHPFAALTRSQFNSCPPSASPIARLHPTRPAVDRAPMRLAARRASSLPSPRPSLLLLSALPTALRARWPNVAPLPAAVSPLHLASPRRCAMSTSSAAGGALAPGSSVAEEGGPMQRTVHSKLTSTFSPSYLRIVNESHMHAVPRGSESHFKVTVVSGAFESLGLLARHRAVNACLAEELRGGIHALSITARTPQQWEADQTVAKSPACLGGSKHDPTKQ